MDKELFDLCRRVYEKIGWDRFVKAEQEQWIGEWWWTYNGKLQDEPIDVLKLLSDQRVCPLYTSDYLLEKLPKQIDGRQLQGYFEDDCTTYGYGKDVTVMHREGLTPLKALLKLTLALSEAGEL